MLTEIATAIGLPNDVITSQPHIESKDVSNAVLYILSQPHNVQVSSHSIMFNKI